MSSPIRFGIFEADLDAGDLRRKGFRLKLQNQPFRVLAALLERPGELVTREELKDRVWASRTLVDFERGLNKAINRLRIALNDSAENPALIETLPRRGYRFIGAIERRMNSLAVLPILNLSGHSDQEHWADGLTDELIGHIARIKALRVISRTSVMRFKASLLTLPEISRQLGVDAVVQGSIQFVNERVRFRIALIDARNDRHLWSDQFESSLGNIANLQADMAHTITRQVQAWLGDVTEIAAHRSGTPFLKREAYEAYLKGRLFWNRRTEGDFERAIECFERAVALEPSYAEAYAGLADTFVMKAIFGLCAPCEVYPKAMAAAQRAIELNEGLAEAHNCLGDILKGYEWDWSGAENAYKHALQLNPNYSVAHQWYSGLLLILGRNELAIAAANKARELDPLSLPINAFLGYVCMKAERFDQAVKASAGAIELDPNNPFGHWIMARTLDAMNDLPGAAEEAKAAARLSSDRMPYSAQLGYAWARLGERKRAREVVDRLKDLAKGRYVSAYPIAAIYAALEDRNAAFEWLERAYVERTPRLLELPDVAFANLGPDPRFRDLLKRIGAASYEHPH